MPLDRTLTLAELVESAAVGDLIEASARFHGVGLALVDLDGHVVVATGVAEAHRCPAHRCPAR